MKRIRGLASIALITALLSGCAATATNSTTGVAPEATMGGKASSSIAADSSATVDRSVIKTASIGLETQKIDEAKSNLTFISKKFEGLVENWSQQSNNAGELWQINATVRVPVASLDESIANISALGQVLNLNVSNSDVTAQVLDIDARTKSLTASVERLQKLMANANNTADLLAAESALSQRQAELESMLSQQNYFKDAVDMSTIYVTIYAEGLGPVSAPTSFIDGLNQGWKALAAFFTGAVVFLGLAVPWLLVVIPLGAVVYLVVRRIRRKPTRSQ
jgi:hypothetical protein